MIARSYKRDTLLLHCFMYIFIIEMSRNSVVVLRFQMHGFQKNFLKWICPQKEKNTKCSSFYLFHREIHNWNVFFYCICLTICSKFMGSRTLLKNSMGSTKPMEPTLTQPLELPTSSVHRSCSSAVCIAQHQVDKCGFKIKYKYHIGLISTPAGVLFFILGFWVGFNFLKMP